jgi:nucleotide-binding universal stress UspA family protein
VAFGHAATEIAGYAQDHGCARIVMGTRGNGSLTNILIGSVANQVLQLAEAPVTLVK